MSHNNTALAFTALILAITGIIVYWVGSLYLYFYFRNFSIGFFEIEHDYRAVSVWGVLCLKREWLYSIALLGIVFIVYQLMYRIKFLKNNYKTYASTFLIVIITVIGLYYIAYESAEKTLQDMLECSYASLPEIEIALDESTTGMSLTGKYRMILRNNENTFIFKNFKVSDPTVWSVNNNIIRHITIYPINYSCR